MQAEDAFEVKAGDVLAEKFRIERVLGIGGMGLVAAAWHLELRTRIALKILRPTASLDTNALERFSREASAVSRLRSEYVVRVFDVGKLPDGGPPYIVMEHLEGEDLEVLVADRGPIAIDEAVGYVLHACEGIAEAHSVGIVHRDLKLANLFRTRRVDGSAIVKVVDFGIAKSEGTTSASLTGPLVAMGSPQYMSPEQTRNSRDVDSATDIWSLGVCLYEMLTGQPPFDGESVAEVIAMVLTSTPRSPDELRAEIPPRLAQVVMRCLRKPAPERFADVGALAEALEEFAPATHRGAAARIQQVLQHGPAPPEAMEASPPASGLDPGAGAAARPARTRPASRRRSMIAIGLAIGVVSLATVSALRWRATTTPPDEASPAPPGPSGNAASAATEEPLSIGLAPGPGRPLTTGAPPAIRPTTKPAKRPAKEIGRTEPEPVPVPVPVPAPSAVVASPAVAPPPRFVLGSARVEIGSAVNTSGTTAANVNRAIAPLGDRLTACYRAALPQMPDPVGGSATLHLETDEDGVITSARVVGGFAAPAPCIAASTSGRKIANVDTGRARADVPLAFRAR